MKKPWTFPLSIAIAFCVCCSGPRKESQGVNASSTPSDGASSIEEPLYPFRIDGSVKKYGLMTTAGKIVVEPIYHNAHIEDYGYTTIGDIDMSVYSASGKKLIDGESQYYFLSREFFVFCGNEPKIYDVVGNPVITDAAEADEMNPNRVYRNSDEGDGPFPPQHFFIADYGSEEPPMRVDSIAGYSKDGRSVYLLPDKRVLRTEGLELKIKTFPFAFDLDLFPVREEARWGYYSTTLGKIVIPCEYDDAGYFLEGIAAVKAEGKCAFIDKAGKRLFEDTFAFASSFGQLPIFRGGFCIVGGMGKEAPYEMINDKGEAVLEYEPGLEPWLLGPRYPGFALIYRHKENEPGRYAELKDKKGDILLSADEIAQPRGDQDVLLFFDSETGVPRLYDLKARSISKPLGVSASTQYQGEHKSFMVGSRTLVDLAKSEVLMVDTVEGKVLFDNWTSREPTIILPSGYLYQWDTGAVIDTQGKRVLPKTGK